MKPENVFPRVLAIFRAAREIGEQCNDLYNAVKDIGPDLVDRGTIYPALQLVQNAVGLICSECLELDSSVEALA